MAIGTQLTSSSRNPPSLNCYQHSTRNNLETQAGMGTSPREGANAHIWRSKIFGSPAVQHFGAAMSNTHATFPAMRGLSDWRASETDNNRSLFDSVKVQKDSRLVVLTNRSPFDAGKTLHTR